MKALKITALSIFSALLLVGCGHSKHKRTYVDKDLQGTVWQLVRFDGKEVHKQDKYELVFDDTGRISGIGECNRFFGEYKVTSMNGAIKMGPVGSTLMACLGSDNIESQYMMMFENVRQYQLEGDKLYLFVDKGHPMAVFKATSKPVENL